TRQSGSHHRRLCAGDAGRLGHGPDAVPALVSPGWNAGNHGLGQLRCGRPPVYAQPGSAYAADPGPAGQAASGRPDRDGTAGRGWTRTDDADAVAYARRATLRARRCGGAADPVTAARVFGTGQT